MSPRRRPSGCQCEFQIRVYSLYPRSANRSLTPASWSRSASKTTRCDGHSCRHARSFKLVSACDRPATGEGGNDSSTTIGKRASSRSYGQQTQRGSLALGALDATYNRGGSQVMNHARPPSPLPCFVSRSRRCRWLCQGVEWQGIKNATERTSPDALKTSTTST